jgi:hypothetical protein
MKPILPTTLLLMVTTSGMFADEFVRPPETYAPVWVTPFPYQRNINIGFDVTPVGTAGSGIPGAIYEGTLDPVLKVSDYVQFTGDTHWYDTLSGFNGTGFIGIDNRSGSSTLHGTATFRLDNTIVPNPEKHLWLELSYSMSPETSFGYGVTGPEPGFWPSLGGPGNVNLGNGFWLLDDEFETSPNPAWETVGFSFTAPAGAVVVFDNVHIATECVPEPAAIALAFLGAGMLIVLRRSKQS